MKFSLWARAATLAGYFGLLVLLLAWHAWLAPSALFPRALMLLVFVVPLLLPLRGLLHGRRYTHQWAPFLALPYLIVGITEAFANPQERALALLEILFSTLLLVGASVYARYGAEQAANET
ncbi:MAG: DUF2069 domain-containing protein [Chromatiales bacterium]|nr:DUF2069 domain-containing protein [Chromatiales bacterium]